VSVSHFVHTPVKVRDVKVNESRLHGLVQH